MTQQIKKGEIWEVETSDGARIYQMVVIQIFSKYAVGLMLRDTAPDENARAVKSRGLMYCDTGRLSYAYEDKFVSFIRGLAQQEFDELRAQVCAALGLDFGLLSPTAPVTTGNSDQERASLEAKLAKAEAECQSLKDERMNLMVELETKTERLHSMENELTDCGPELAAVKRERDIFERLYREILDRLLKR